MQILKLLRQLLPLPTPPSRVPTQPYGSRSSSVSETAATQTTAENKKPEAPSTNKFKEDIKEPTFASKITDFDINKFGPPPPKPFKTREEQEKEKRDQEFKQRMATRKQESIEKARGIKSPSPSPSPMTASKLSPQTTNNSSKTNNSGEEPGVPKPYVPVDIHQFQPPPPTPKNRQQSASPLSAHHPPGVPARSNVHSPSPPGNNGPPASLPQRPNVASPPPRPPNAHGSEQIQDQPHPAKFKLIDVASVGPPPPKTMRPPQEQTQKSHLPSIS
ncbi:unnamed protein product [[Candida] boidinii]|nr:unnamed protein product [[Candida] boidinii]